MPLPATPGSEAAGTVVAVGPDADHVRARRPRGVGRRAGAYAERAAVPVERLVALPDRMSARQGAAVMLQGMTAHYLASSTYPLKPGDTCLVHAAAGGVGLLLCQIAQRRGARVIGTVSTPEKAALAREAGADEVIRYTEQDFEAEVRRLTAAPASQVVYDSVGRTTFERRLRCLAPRGMMVLFGQSSGPIGPFDPQVLSQRGSLYLDPAVPLPTTSPRGRSSSSARRGPRLGAGRQAQAADRARVPPGARGGRAPGAGGAADDGEGAARAMIRGQASFFGFQPIPGFSRSGPEFRKT